MAINPRADLIPLPYIPGDVVSNDLVKFLYLELIRLRQTVDGLTEGLPQVADAPPVSPRRGTIRFALAPWDPLGTAFEGYVVFDGSAWVAL